jgi:hypothetical protein
LSTCQYLSAPSSLHTAVEPASRFLAAKHKSASRRSERCLRLQMTTLRAGNHEPSSRARTRLTVATPLPQQEVRAHADSCRSENELALTGRAAHLQASRQQLPRASCSPGGLSFRTFSGLFSSSIVVQRLAAGESCSRLPCGPALAVVGNVCSSAPLQNASRDNFP